MYEADTIIDGVPKHTDLLTQLQKMEDGIADIPTSGGSSDLDLRVETREISIELWNPSVKGELYTSSVNLYRSDGLVPVGVLGWHVRHNLTFLPMTLGVEKENNRYWLNSTWYCLESEEVQIIFTATILYASHDLTEG